MIIMSEDEYPENLPELLKDEKYKFVKAYHPTQLSEFQMVVTIPKEVREALGIEYGKEGGRLACFYNREEGILIYIRVDRYGKILKPRKAGKSKKKKN